MKYRITLLESERGWGQKYWTEDYKTLEEAHARIQSINAENTSDIVPDYYIMADARVEVVE